MKTTEEKKQFNEGAIAACNEFMKYGIIESEAWRKYIFERIKQKVMYKIDDKKRT